MRRSPAPTGPAGRGLRAAARASARAQHAAAERLAARLRTQDPELLQALAEVGVVRQAWLDDPTDLPAVQATRPLEVLQRAVEARADRGRAPLASFGLSALRLLSDLGPGGTAGPAVLTLCFTDLEGFTRYTAVHGDRPARALLSDHYRTAGRIVRSRGGRVVKRLGDGLLLRFTDPADAIRAALDLVDRGPGALPVRVGVHQGELLVDRDDLIGHAVNVTARVVESARGGQVLVTGAVRAALPDGLAGVRFGRLRRRRLKGLAERVPLYPVTRDALTGPSRPL